MDISDVVSLPAECSTEHETAVSLLLGLCALCVWCVRVCVFVCIVGAGRGLEAARAVLTVRSQSGHSQVTVRSTVRSQSGHVFCGHFAIF